MVTIQHELYHSYLQYSRVFQTVRQQNNSKYLKFNALWLPQELHNIWCDSKFIQQITIYAFNTQIKKKKIKIQEESILKFSEFKYCVLVKVHVERKSHNTTPIECSNFTSQAYKFSPFLTILSTTGCLEEVSFNTNYFSRTQSKHTIYHCCSMLLPQWDLLKQSLKLLTSVHTVYAENSSVHSVEINKAFTSGYLSYKFASNTQQ